MRPHRAAPWRRNEVGSDLVRKVTGAVPAAVGNEGSDHRGELAGVVPIRLALPGIREPTDRRDDGVIEAREDDRVVVPVCGPARATLPSGSTR
jgi:hypothetical protein